MSDVLSSVSPTVGRKAGANLNLIALAVLQAFDAKLLAFLDEVLRILAVNGNELRDVRLRAAQVFREFEAETRWRRFVVGLVVRHAETVLGAQLVVDFARRLVVSEIEAEFQRVDRGAPIGPRLKRSSENEKRVRLVGRFGRPLITAVGSARRIDGKIVTLAAVVGVGLDGEKRLGESRPGRPVLVVGGNGVGQVSRGGAWIGSEHFFGFGFERGRASCRPASSWL